MKTYSIQWLDISNRALARISSAMLAKMNEGTLEANYVNVLLPSALEAVYASLPFDDTTCVTDLPVVPSDGTSGYLFSYKLPESATRINEVITVPTGANWQIVQGLLLSNATQVKVRYVSIPNDPADMPFYARELVVLKLASMLASPVSHNEALASSLASEYQSQLANAITFAAPSRMQGGYMPTSSYADRE